MRFSPWTHRAVIAVVCVWIGPRVAVGFPWRLPPNPNRANATRRTAPAGTPTITVVGDRLVISGDDPKKVALAYDLARLILEDKGQSYRTFRLQYASATELAQVLEEWFNGPPKPAPNPLASLMMIRGGRGVRPTPPEPPKPPRVHVVAEPATNSLIVRAGTLDLVSIDHLIRDALDVAPTDTDASTKPFIIGPLQNAVATEVVRLLKEVYLEDTDQTRGRSGRGRPRPQPLDPSGRPKPILLSIAADDRTNSIVGMASESMAAGIRKVVAVIEAKSHGDQKTAELVPVPGVDPSVVQQVLDAIQYRPPVAQPSSRSTSAIPPSRR
jgi:hypothetical protein